jgi:hypothetical protein
MPVKHANIVGVRQPVAESQQQFLLPGRASDAVQPAAHPAPHAHRRPAILKEPNRLQMPGSRRLACSVGGMLVGQGSVGRLVW